VAHSQTRAPSAEDSAAGVTAALHGGRYADALGTIARMLQAGDAAGIDLALLAATLTETWQPAQELSLSRLSPRQAAGYWYVQGVLAARAAWPGGRSEPLARARESVNRLARLASVEDTFERTELRRVSVLAAIAAAQEERDELTLLVAHGQHIASQLNGAGVPDDDLLPFDELVGDLWLQLHRFSDALQHYRAAVGAHPVRTRAWIGRARAARELGEAREAQEAAREVLQRWRLADPHLAARPEMLALAEAPALASGER
jgi:hypothetical protein